MAITRRGDSSSRSGCRKLEIVTLEIMFGRDRKEDIVVYQGDNPRDLAFQFVEKHSLKASAMIAIQSALERAIKEFRNAASPSAASIDKSESPNSKNEETKEEIFHNDLRLLKARKQKDPREDYRGQPPIELQYNGLPEVSQVEGFDGKCLILNEQITQSTRTVSPSKPLLHLSVYPYPISNQLEYSQKTVNSCEENVSNLSTTGLSDGPASVKNAFHFTDDEPLLFAEENPGLSNFRSNRLKSGYGELDNTELTKSASPIVSSFFSNDKNAVSGESKNICSTETVQFESSSSSLTNYVSCGDSAKAHNDNVEMTQKVNDVPDSRTGSRPQTPTSIYDEIPNSSSPDPVQENLQNSRNEDSRHRNERLSGANSDMGSYLKPCSSSTIESLSFPHMPLSGTSTPYSKPASARVLDFFGSNMSSKELKAFTEYAVNSDSYGAGDGSPVKSPVRSSTQNENLNQSRTQSLKIDHYPSTPLLYEGMLLGSRDGTSNSNMNTNSKSESKSSRALIVRDSGSSHRVNSSSGIIPEGLLSISSMINSLGNLNFTIVPPTSNSTQDLPPPPAPASTSSHVPVHVHVPIEGNESLIVVACVGAVAASPNATPTISTAGNSLYSGLFNTTESGNFPVTISDPASGHNHSISQQSSLEYEEPVSRDESVTLGIEHFYEAPTQLSHLPFTERAIKKSAASGNRLDDEICEVEDKISPENGISEEEIRFNILKSTCGKNDALVPKTSTLVLNRLFQPELQSFIGSSSRLLPSAPTLPGHRLYESGRKSRLKREKKITESKSREDKERKATRFTLNECSLAIVNQRRSSHQNESSDVCSRLHESGLKIIREVKKQIDMGRNRRIEWCCTRCRTFQVYAPQSAHSDLHTPVSQESDHIKTVRYGTVRSLSGSVTSESVSTNGVQVCKTCGLDQDVVSVSSGTQQKSIHQSGVFSQENLPSKSYSNSLRSNELNGSRGRHAYGNLGSTIHDSLHADRKHQTIIRRAKELQEKTEAADRTHRPVVPEGSLLILERKIQGPDWSGDCTYGYYSMGETPGDSMRGGGSRAAMRAAQVPHRSKSSGSYPKSRPLDPGMRCSSSFAPQSSWRSAMMIERSGRDRDSKSIFSSSEDQGQGQGLPPPPPPRARTFAEYLQTPATERLFHTKDTPPREVTHRRGVAASRSNSLSPCRSPNTTLQPDGTPYSKTGPPPPRRPVILSPDRYQILVDRLAYEYKDNDLRREIAIIEATARDPLTGRRYFQPTVFAAPKHPVPPVRPVYPHKTLDPDSMPVEKRVEGNGKNNGFSSSHIKGSASLAITVPSATSSTSTSTSASTCASVSKTFSASVSTGVSSRVRRTPEEVYRALTNTQCAHRDTQKSSQLQVELLEQNEKSDNEMGSIKCTVGRTQPPVQTDEAITMEANNERIQDLYFLLLESSSSNTTSATTSNSTPTYSPCGAVRQSCSPHNALDPNSIGADRETVVCKENDEKETNYEAGEEVEDEDDEGEFVDSIILSREEGGAALRSLEDITDSETFQNIEKHSSMLSRGTETLDLESLDSQYLIPEVAILLEQMRHEKARMNHMHETGLIGRGRSRDGPLTQFSSTDLGSGFRVNLKEFTALVKKCLSNVGVGVGGGVGEEEYEIEQIEKRRQSSSPYVLISPEESVLASLSTYEGMHCVTESSGGRDTEEGQREEEGQGEGEALLMHVRTVEDKVKDIKYIKSLSARAVARKSAAIKHASAPLPIHPPVPVSVPLSVPTPVPVHASVPISVPVSLPVPVPVCVSESVYAGPRERKWRIAAHSDAAKEAEAARPDTAHARRTPRIENVLILEGHRRTDRINAARLDFIRLERELHTFKPTLSKPPKYITARYKVKTDVLLPPPPPPPPQARSSQERAEVRGTHGESSIQNEEFEFSVRIKYPIDTNSTDSTYMEAPAPAYESSPFRGNNQGGESHSPGCEEIKSESSHHSKGAQSPRLKQTHEVSRRHSDSNSDSNSSNGVVMEAGTLPNDSPIKCKEVSNAMHQSTAAAESEAKVKSKSPSDGFSEEFQQSNLSNSALAAHNQHNNSSMITNYKDDKTFLLARQLFSSELSENSCVSSYSGSSFSTIHHSTYRSHALRSSRASLSASNNKPGWDSNKKVVHDDSASARSLQPALAGRTMRPRVHPREVRTAQNQGSGHAQGQGLGISKDRSLSQEGTSTRPPPSHASQSIVSDKSKTSSEERNTQHSGDGDSVPLFRSRPAGHLRDTRDTRCSARMSCYVETGTTVSVRLHGDSRPYIPPPLPLEIQKRKEFENRQML